MAALAIALRVSERPHVLRARGLPATAATEFPGEGARVEADAARDVHDLESAAARPGAPTSLVNRLLIAAILLNAGGYFAGGMYEVIWSLFLTSRGGGLDLVGLTFAIFGGVVLIFSPIAGRVVDRRGGYAFIVAGIAVTGFASLVYPFLPTPVLAVPVVALEASGFAISNPAIFAVVAAGSPRGRSSTAQGIYGAAGTFGTIVASVMAGYLAAIDIRYPFFVVAIVIAIVLAVGLAVGGSDLRRVGRPRAPVGDAGNEVRRTLG